MQVRESRSVEEECMQSEWRSGVRRTATSMTRVSGECILTLRCASIAFGLRIAWRLALPRVRIGAMWCTRLGSAGEPQCARRASSACASARVAHDPS
jgi:hypothetical protein